MMFTGKIQQYQTKEIFEFFKFNFNLFRIYSRTGEHSLIEARVSLFN